MSKATPQVIVLSRNYSTGLGVIRSLGAAGYPVDLIASTKKKGSSIIASCSKYVNHAIEVLSPKIQDDTGEGLINALMAYAGKWDQEKPIVFPTDDFTASVVDRHKEKLMPHFVFPRTTDKEFTIETLMDKTFQGKLAREQGLHTAEEWIISLREDICIPKDVIYPCFVKPLQSVSGHKTEMKKCDTEEELYLHLQGMQNFHRDRSVLIQKFMQIDTEYDLSGVCLDQEIILPAIIEKTRTAMYERGVAVSGKLHSPDIFGETLEQIKMMLRRFHYVGMFDIDVYASEGKLYFSEVNFRSGGLSFSYFLNGVNLPAIYVKGVSGQEILPEETVMKNFGKTFVYEKVAWEDYIYQYMTKKELTECIESADYTLLANAEDPKPGEYFQRRIRLSAMKQKAKRMLKRGGKCRSISTTASESRVVIIGRNYGNILTMARDVGRAGYGVDVLRVYKRKPKSINLMAQMKPDAYSKYVNQFEECIANDQSEAIIEKLMEMSGRGRKLLIPVDDYSAHVVDAYLQRLSTVYVVQNIGNKEGEICRLMDKFEQKQLAEAYNLPVLRSTLIQSVDRKFTIPDDVQFPCFVKPNVSMKNTKAMMRKCDSKEELNRMLESFVAKEDIEVLVEPFADILHEYSILGISTPDGAIAPGMFRAVEGGNRERKGVAIVGETVSCDEYRKIIDSCSGFVSSLEYTGLFDIDLIETMDGNLYFVELNFRAGASIHAFSQSGVNLPGMYAAYMLDGKPIDMDCKVPQTGKRFVSEKVLLEEFTRSDTNFKQVKDHMENADICFIKDTEDQKPYRHFRKYYAVAALMRIPYRVRDRKVRG